MTGETNLDTLLHHMQPELDELPYVFLTAESFPARIIERALMFFRETEGMSLILAADDTYVSEAMRQQIWAKITMMIHSDLTAVGFLAKLTERLAAGGISVNAVSAFYHDHLFVPWEKREEAMDLLK